MRFKIIVLPWLVWLSGLSASLQTERLLVQFPVRAHAWVAGPWLQGMQEATDRCLSPFLSPSFPFSLKINKENLKIK